MFSSFRLVPCVAALALLSLSTAAQAQMSGQEFPPPQGRGRVVVVSSGMSGPSHYVAVAQEIAKLGYDVVLFDGNAEEHTQGQGVRSAIQAALGMPHAIQGKVALVGFSLGGFESLYYGSQWADQVLGVVAWYPANQVIQDVPGFASRQQVPLVVFAGGRDHFRNGCCTAAKDQSLQSASQGAGKTFDLTVYPDADHDFVLGGANYNASDYNDAFQKTAAALRRFFADSR